MPKRSTGGEGKKHPLNMRTTRELREKLDVAAGHSGRSLVQEVEYRLERSFADEQAFAHPELRFWSYYMAGTFEQRGRFEAGIKGHPEWTPNEWMKDPDCYQAAMFEVIRSMLLKQPEPNLERLSVLIEGLKMELLHASTRSQAS